MATNQSKKKNISLKTMKLFPEVEKRLISCIYFSYETEVMISTVTKKDQHSGRVTRKAKVSPFMLLIVFSVETINK